MNVVFKLLDDEFLIADDALDEVADRHNANYLLSLKYWQMVASKTRPVLRLDLWPGPAYFTPMSSALHELERRVRRFEPCLPRPAKKPPTGPGWIHAIKHDGFRIVAHCDTDRVRLVTRNGFELAFRMGNVLVFAVVGALFALTPLATFAQSPPGPAGPVTASPRSGWSIIEEKSATGKSAQFSAGIIVGDTALILRCRDQRTEAAFSTEDTDLGEESVKVRYRIDLNEPIQQAWRSSINGRAAFAPKPMDLIRALPDNGRIFIRAIASDGSNKDTNFIISGTSAIRDKIARACNWPATSEEPVGSIPTPKEP